MGRHVVRFPQLIMFYLFGGGEVVDIAPVVLLQVGKNVIVRDLVKLQ